MTARRILVTGATGLIGYSIVEAALKHGYQVRALVREPAKVQQSPRSERGVPREINALQDTELVAGDILEPSTLPAAVKGVDLVFHAAGMPEQWQRDESVFDRVNRLGTKNVLEASLAEGVSRVVYTSTMDVFAAPSGGTLLETNIDIAPKPTAYERSKQAAEREAEGIAKRGLDIVYVNPGATYGPCLQVGALNLFFQRLLNRELPLLPPGGMPIVFNKTLAAAHLAAANVGRRGERYLVADAHLSMNELARVALSFAASKRRVPATGPVWLMQALANISAPLARSFGFQPLVAPGELSFVLWNVRIDASKAQRDLGYEPLAPEVGIRATIEWLERRARVRQLHLPQ